MADTINWPGESGAKYRYWFVDIEATIQAVSGNYMFVKKVSATGWVPVYIGESENLADRLPNHDRWNDAKRAGATHVMAHTTPTGESARMKEEKDLIQRWSPPLNVQHRKVS